MRPCDFVFTSKAIPTGVRPHMSPYPCVCVCIADSLNCVVMYLNSVPWASVFHPSVRYRGMRLLRAIRISDVCHKCLQHRSVCVYLSVCACVCMCVRVCIISQLIS